MYSRPIQLVSYFTTEKEYTYLQRNLINCWKKFKYIRDFCYGRYGMTDTAEVNGAQPDGVTDPTRSQKTSEFVLLLKDREALKASLEGKEKELNSTKARHFELLQQVDKLEKELSELKTLKKADKDARKLSVNAQSQSTSPTGTPVSTPKGGRKVRPKTAKHANSRQKPRKAGKPPTIEVTSASEATKEAHLKDTYKYYEEIASTYPHLKLSVLLAAEKKFVEADVNKDGTIDADELEAILESSSLLFTKQQVRDIVKQIDNDQSSDLDFMECLAVIDRLHQNKKTNLPTTLEQNKSTVCVIQ
ncbi:uncharacterized protein LOC119741003 [Patiria miniata]|uniref:EF-hand domain-containing protein n=1 Tax=Patiria miniata TaxID=46514 RepID=A0A914B8K7_PATMI|nr:uncharacterized protein LOC119741003 [Patiria miniata]